MNSIIEAFNITKTYFLRNETINVLKGIDLEIKKGHFVVILGPSGSGKSTLLNVLGSIDRPTSGKIIFDSKDLSLYKDTKLSEIRNKKIGFIFQFHHLLAEFSCIENIALPAMVNGTAATYALEKALSLMEKFDMADKKNRLPGELSGGERQRVAVARALINEPGILFADEPTASLDSESSITVLKLFKKLNKELKQTIIMVTHEPDDEVYVDRVIRLSNGLIDIQM